MGESYCIAFVFSLSTGGAAGLWLRDSLAVSRGALTRWLAKQLSSARSFWWQCHDREPEHIDRLGDRDELREFHRLGDEAVRVKVISPMYIFIRPRCGQDDHGNLA